MAEYSRGTGAEKVSVKIVLDYSKINPMLHEVRERAVNKAATTVARRAQANVTRAGRVRTGLMRESIRAGRAFNAGTQVTHVYVSVQGRAGEYAGYQEFGTRAHGPKKAKFMRFKPKGSNTFVFAKWVRGVKPAHFMSDAYKSLTANDFIV